MINKEDFVKAMVRKRNYSCAGVVENLEDPPGRNPSDRDLNLSKIYKGLSEEQKLGVNEIIKEGIDQAYFSLLCVFDHVGFIEDDEDKTVFELYAIKNGQKELLNPFSGEEMHDIYNSLVMEKNE